MSEPQIRVTVEDLETGEMQAMEIADDYAIVTAGVCQVTHINTYPVKGTHVLTVKNAARGMKREVEATGLTDRESILGALLQWMLSDGWMRDDDNSHRTRLLLHKADLLSEEGRITASGEALIERLREEPVDA